MLKQNTDLLGEAGKNYKYLPYIVSIYSFCFLFPSILLRKMVDVPYIGVVPVSILFTGTYFMLLDIVTEVYGYYEARRMLFAGLITYSIFVFALEAIVNIPSPLNYQVAWGAAQDASAYNKLFGGIYLVWFSVVICSLFANTLNIIVLSKWKILIKGRYFWLRSVTSSFFTALIYSAVSNLFAFGIFMNASQAAYFFKLVVISVSAKLFTLIVFAYPATILCGVLKRKEGVDIYDYHIDYNPLRAQPN